MKFTYFVYFNFVLSIRRIPYRRASSVLVTSNESRVT